MVKAITIRQPYAWLIVNGIKDIENRTWETKYRGPVYIHAGLKRPTKQLMDALEAKHGITIPDDELDFGAIIGSVELVDCVITHSSRWFIAGHNGFVLRKPRVIFPGIPYTGKLGLFQVPKDLHKCPPVNVAVVVKPERLQKVLSLGV